MMQLVYTKAAVADLQRLREFIAAHDPNSAARVATELCSRIEKLRDFPQLGRMVHEAPNPILVRDMVSGRYVIRYAVQGDLVVILRIWHHFERRTPL
jgi:plasmid stabilization system protein ParE